MGVSDYGIDDDRIRSLPASHPVQVLCDALARGTSSQPKADRISKSGISVSAKEEQTIGLKSVVGPHSSSGRAGAPDDGRQGATLERASKEGKDEGKGGGDSGSGSKDKDSIASSRSALRTLDLSFSALGASGAFAICDALSSNSHVTALNLSHAQLGQYADRVVDFLKQNGTLRSLDLSHNNMGECEHAGM